MPNQKYPPEKTREVILDAGENRRPLISCFFGIFIRVCFDDSGRLHAEYGNDAAAFDFGGRLLAGELPAKQRMYVEVWADLRRAELAILAKLLQSEDAYFQIKGLE